MENLKLIYDCDPGTDDIVALAILLGSSQLDLCGITTVAGNVELAQTTQNALDALSFFGRGDIHVYQGARQPLIRGLASDGAHGDTGLGNLDLPRSFKLPERKSAHDFLITTANDHYAETSQKLTVLATGPLTNIATALIADPDLIGKMRLVVMGGCENVYDAESKLRHGNITPQAEFNFYVDPDAANFVMQSGVNTTLLPLDATQKLVSTPERWQRFAGLPEPYGDAAVSLLRAAEHLDIPKFGVGGAFFHDPAAAACLLRPELYLGTRSRVEVSIDEGYTRGKMTTNPGGKVFVVRDIVDPDAIYDLAFNSFKSLARSPLPLSWLTSVSRPSV